MSFYILTYLSLSLSARPVTAQAQSALIDDLQDAKTEFYKKIIDEIASARPGVLELMDEAIADPNLKASMPYLKASISNYLQ